MMAGAALASTNAPPIKIKSPTAAAASVNQADIAHPFSIVPDRVMFLVRSCQERKGHGQVAACPFYSVIRKTVPALLLPPWKVVPKR